MKVDDKYYRLKSERLNCRKLTLDDASEWQHFFENNDRLKYLGIPDLTLPHHKLAEDWITLQLERYIQNGLGHLAVIHNDKLIGLSGIIPREIEIGEVYEIGFSFLPEYWGQGFATEMAKLLKNFAFNTLNVSAVYSIIHKENLPSMAVARKNGMKPILETRFMGMPVYLFQANKL